MERCANAGDIILLFDNYTSESEYLHKSFCQAGYKNIALVLEENYFLPEDVISVYELFLGYNLKKGKQIGKPKYFNEIAIPDSWSINALDQTKKFGMITYQQEEKGRIYYADTDKNLIVKEVEWYDRKRCIRFRDHYNRYGAVCARTIYNSQAERMSKSWFSINGQEVIVENYVTGDIILNDDRVVRFFRSKMDLLVYGMEKAGISQKPIYYNSLSTPFFLSNRLASPHKEDILFWQEPVGEEIPGNMKMILDGKAKRTSRIIIQKRHSYQKLLELGVKQNQIGRLGYIYNFQKENQHKAEALICTNSDHMEHCRELIEALPHMHFHIAAITQMSSKLLALETYENVSLYPGIKIRELNDLFKRCDFYFDINYQAEIVSAVRRAFLHNQLIVAFEETVHHREYMADVNTYMIAEFDRMVSDIRKVMKDYAEMEQRLKQQRADAMAENKKSYIEIIHS